MESISQFKVFCLLRVMSLRPFTQIIPAAHSASNSAGTFSKGFFMARRCWEKGLAKISSSGVRAMLAQRGVPLWAIGWRAASHSLQAAGVWKSIVPKWNLLRGDQQSRTSFCAPVATTMAFSKRAQGTKISKSRTPQPLPIEFEQHHGEPNTNERWQCVRTRCLGELSSPDMHDTSNRTKTVPSETCMPLRFYL